MVHIVTSIQDRQDSFTEEVVLSATASTVEEGKVTHCDSLWPTDVPARGVRVSGKFAFQLLVLHVS